MILSNNVFGAGDGHPVCGESKREGESGWVGERKCFRAGGKHTREGELCWHGVTPCVLYVCVCMCRRVCLHVCLCLRERVEL